MATEPSPERRKDKRFKPAAPAFVEYSADYLSTGQIVDIGTGGLSFRYMSRDQKPQTDFQLRIYSSRGDLSIENVPVKTIYDFATPFAFTITKATVRRRGVRFTALSPAQSTQLEHFIQNYAQEAQPE